MNVKAKKFKKFLLVLAVLVCLMFFSCLGLFLLGYSKYDLNINKLTSLNNGIKVYSASGEDNTLYNTNRSIVEIETLPDYVKNAFIDTEDKRFYEHNGFDIKRILKSSYVNFTTKSKSQGASTISQQLIKNALLSNEKTYSRKFKEIILSIKMEKTFEKDEILEMYLNTIYFGNNAYGIENASKIYFNKSAKDLTKNEACCLAGIIKSPGQFSPTFNYANSISRRNIVAQNMLKNGNLSLDDYEKIINSQIVINQVKENDNSYEKEAIFEACSLLNMTERELINKNYQILTFKQDKIQKEVIISNDETINNAETTTNTDLDSLSVVVNNKGQVLSYYANSNYNLHNLTRQPASTLKPLAVYLPCFKHNILSPATEILDEEINYNGFSPQNADNKFHGYITTREALSHSLNIPAVKALDYLGVKKAKQELENLGINITNNDLNLSLALGATKNGVNVLDLISAYLTLANNGNFRPICFVDKILDENNNVIYSFDDYYEKVTDEASCFLVNDILKDCAKTGTAKRLAELNLNVASKTGTATNGYGNTDLFNIAYTTEHTILTWVADISENTLPNSLLSSSQPTDINKDILNYLYHEHKPADFEIPDRVQRIGYDLEELTLNHNLVQPNHSIERYIGYDYFKSDNLPPVKIDENKLKLVIDVGRFGAVLNFETVNYKSYEIYKKVDESDWKLYRIIEKQSGKQSVLDASIFDCSDIQYYISIKDENQKSEIISIKPKDYLINDITNDLVISKKKWWV